MPGMASFLMARSMNPPGMDHVIGREQQTNLRAARHNERPVDVKQVVIDGERIDARLFASRFHARLRQAGIEGDIGVLVLVVPLPLIAGYDDGHVGLARIFQL